mmetsp:Transcript_2581/g.5934  ORF Transcript_2581/g.5934 Transcript_2581/m.5934 type:complete len:390 (-) Transcript_2581:1527-2696(-)
MKLEIEMLQPLQVGEHDQNRPPLLQLLQHLVLEHIEVILHFPLELPSHRLPSHHLGLLRVAASPGVERLLAERAWEERAPLEEVLLEQRVLLLRETVERPRHSERKGIEARDLRVGQRAADRKHPDLARGLPRFPECGGGKLPPVALVEVGEGGDVAVRELLGGDVRPGVRVHDGAARRVEGVRVLARPEARRSAGRELRDAVEDPVELGLEQKGKVRELAQELFREHVLAQHSHALLRLAQAAAALPHVQEQVVPSNGAPVGIMQELTREIWLAVERIAEEHVYFVKEKDLAPNRCWSRRAHDEVLDSRNKAVQCVVSAAGRGGIPAQELDELFADVGHIGPALQYAARQAVKVGVGNKMLDPEKLEELLEFLVVALREVAAVAHDID